jgi:hypothetical protein
LKCSCRKGFGSWKNEGLNEIKVSLNVTAKTRGEGRADASNLMGGVYIYWSSKIRSKSERKNIKVGTIYNELHAKIAMRLTGDYVRGRFKK